MKAINSFVCKTLIFSLLVSLGSIQIHAAPDVKQSEPIITKERVKNALKAIGTVVFVGLFGYGIFAWVKYEMGKKEARKRYKENMRAHKDANKFDYHRAMHENNLNAARDYYTQYKNAKRVLDDLRKKEKEAEKREKESNRAFLYGIPKIVTKKID